MEDLFNPEEKIQCPYDSMHYVMRYRMAKHIVKCKKNFPEQKKVACDYNASHFVDEPELAYHHQVCEDRKKVEPIILQGLLAQEDKFPIYNVHVSSGENWDDLQSTTYNPQKNVQESEILRRMDIESKSKRKDFRVAERLRISEINKKGEVPQSSLTRIVHLPSVPDKVTPIDEKSSVVDELKNKIRGINVTNTE